MIFDIYQFVVLLKILVPQGYVLLLLGTDMHLLGVKKVQICNFKGTASGTCRCTQKGTLLTPYFSVRKDF